MDGETSPRGKLSGSHTCKVNFKHKEKRGYGLWNVLIKFFLFSFEGKEL